MSSGIYVVYDLRSQLGARSNTGPTPRQTPTLTVGQALHPESAWEHWVLTIRSPSAVHYRRSQPRVAVAAGRGHCRPHADGF